MRSEVHSECGGETFFGERAETGAAERQGSGGAEAAEEIVEVVEKRLTLAQLLALEGLLRHAHYREQSLQARMERGHNIITHICVSGMQISEESGMAISLRSTPERRDWKLPCAVWTL